MNSKTRFMIRNGTRKMYTYLYIHIYIYFICSVKEKQRKKEGLRRLSPIIPLCNFP